jgi:hypothetical protein
MKKSVLILSGILLSSYLLIAQNAKTASYPVPEYSNEIYLVKKDTSLSLMRLEKGSSKMEMKVKMMGMGGMNQGYELEGEKSTVRFPGGNNLVFVFYAGGGGGSTTAEADSAMRANGMDASMMANPMASMMDPSQNISLYNMVPEKGRRKIMLQSMGMMGKFKKSSTKYTLSIKKVKENYYEMTVDKTLPRGNYAFVMMDTGSMDQSYSLFAFEVAN